MICTCKDFVEYNEYRTCVRCIIMLQFENSYNSKGDEKLCLSNL